MRRSRSPSDRRRFLSPLHALCVVVAVVLGVAIFASKGRAAPAGPPLGVASGRPMPVAPSGRPPITSASAAPQPSAAPAASGSAAPAGSAAYVEPLSYAVERTAADLPADLSEEQKRALGVGMPGVMIQREGKFRSPFAHPRFGGPAHVRVAMTLAAVHDYDIQKGTYTADFYLTLLSDKDMPPLSLMFTNGKEESSVKLADLPTFKMYRFVGTFFHPVDLRGFPADAQTLSIQIEAQNMGIDQIVFEDDADHTSLDAGFSVPGWDIASLSATTRNHYYPSRFPHDDLYYSRYTFELGLERFGTSAIFSVFVPAIVIVLISLLGMWVPPTEMEVRSNAGAPMLVGAVLFHFSLMQALPATGYLTRADKLMIAVYASLVMNMVSTWFFFLVDEERWDLVFRVARTLVPILTVIAMVSGVVL